VHAHARNVDISTVHPPADDVEQNQLGDDVLAHGRQLRSAGVGQDRPAVEPLVGRRVDQ
jgi:hypothetical protein